MGQILVRNINDEALANLKSKALSKGQSLESLVRELIEVEGIPNRQELIKEMQHIRALSKSAVPSLTKEQYRGGLE